MTTNDKKLELKLNEDNELSFRLSIEGTVSDPQLASPKFRFTITELDNSNGETGWIFPAKKEADDIVTVSIPAPLKSGFKANRVYKGTLEVILGRLYFSPAEMQLEFSTPLEIQAEVATITSDKKSDKAEKQLLEGSPSSSNQKRSAEPDDFDEEEILSVIVEERAKRPNQVPPATISKGSISSKASPKITHPPRPQTSQTLVQKKKGQDRNDLAQKNELKARLMSMFKEALKTDKASD